jgi:hypothetical protein
MVEANEDLLQDETESCQLFLFAILISTLDYEPSKMFTYKKSLKERFPTCFRHT